MCDNISGQSYVVVEYDPCTDDLISKVIYAGADAKRALDRYNSDLDRALQVWEEGLMEKEFSHVDAIQPRLSGKCISWPGGISCVPEQ